ncbi:hypothetical protein [uncultured Bacteroides sp.]|uniref:hypothetical protein n=1 Tax=uncultured Bacteroides sp. TaxID=162156 RepID=UPI0026287A53|nr:hypothetical protein [uncultured Bacteroides sp.]
MNKKYLSVILFGTLMLGTTGTFTSCKDYDDDITNLQTQVDGIKADLKALQAKVDAGKYVTNVTKSGVGIVITWNDNTTSTIETIKGDKGDKGEDGKAGTVVTIVDGYWAFDGVKSEYPAVGPKGDKGDPGKDGVDGKDGVNGTNGADGHDAKVSENGYWMVWDAEAGKYVETEYIAGGVRAVETAGGYNLTVRDENGDEQTIFVPTSPIMGYIDVLNNDVAGYPVGTYNDNMKVLYGINAKDVKYGPNKEKTLAKGLYVTLDRDLKLVVNPQETDASGYHYSLLNSANQNTQLLFKEAVPYKGDVLTRAASENGIWVLPHDFTRYEDITDARTKNYLLFKANDGYRHALTLTATLNNTTIKTPYDLGASLKKINGVTVYIKNMENCAVNKVYFPDYSYQSVDANAVYDYWLTFEQSASNLKAVELYGAKIVEDGHAFTYTRETGVNNNVQLVYNYILMDGTVVEGVSAPRFWALMREEMAAEHTITLDRLETAFNATFVSSLWANSLGHAHNSANGQQVFAMTTEAYSLAGLFSQMSDVEKLVFKSAMANNSFEAELIGGDGENNTQNNNHINLRNIAYSYSATANTITFQFAVSSGYAANFLLNKAYELTMTVLDEDTGTPVASIVLPFELSQPTLNIIRTNDKWTVWSGAALTSYGAYGPATKDNGTPAKMYLPMYEAFKAWTTKYTVFDKEAVYYWLKQADKDNVSDPTVQFLGQPAGTDVHLNPNLTYSSTWSQWATWANDASVTYNAAGAEVEKKVSVKASFSHYGVYPEPSVTNFDLTFASLLKHSTLKMAAGKETLVVNTGTHDVFISNDNLDLTTPVGGKFFFFDGIDGNETVVARKTLNEASFNEEQRGFMTVNEIYQEARFEAKAKNGSTTYDFRRGGKAGWKIDPQTGKVSYTVPAPDAQYIKIYQVDAVSKRQGVSNEVADLEGTLVGGHTGGLVIQLPTSVADQEEVLITMNVRDGLGFTNKLQFTVKKIK